MERLRKRKYIGIASGVSITYLVFKDDFCYDLIWFVMAFGHVPRLRQSIGVLNPI